MTISKGIPWERPAESDVVPAVTSSDFDAATKASQGLQSSPAVLRLAPGDLLNTLGYEATPDPPAGLEFSMDLAFVEVDGRDRLPFVSHLVARRRFWSGTCLVAMNAAWVGDLYLGPKAHPNDGLLDVTYGSMGWQQRLLARKRARLGTHAPHPDLTTKRVSNFEIELDQPTPLFIDGHGIGTGTILVLSLQPDAFKVVT